MRQSPPPRITRRAMLARLGLTGAAAYVAPALTELGAARASSFSAPSRPSFSAPSRPRRARRRRPPPRPELVILIPIGAAVAPIEALGYGVVARRSNGLLQGDVLRLQAPANRTLAQARSEIGGLLPVRALDLNTLYRPNAILCEDGDCAAFEMIDWRPRLDGCSLRPRIGMVDTGVNPEQPALRGQRLRVLEAGQGERTAASALHGTAIATLLIGRADSRTPGLLPEAELVAVNAFFVAGGEDAADVYAIAEAVDVLIDERVAVINMSFTGPANDLLAELVGRARDAGVAIVAAAGNGGPLADPAYPAAYPEVIAVTAVDRTDRVYRKANRGPYISFAAPGVDLWTAASISGGRLRSGTSYAAPFVTAALAARRAEVPDEPMADSLAVLARHARDLGEAGMDETFGHGVLGAGFLCTSPQG